MSVVEKSCKKLISSKNKLKKPYLFYTYLFIKNTYFDNVYLKNIFDNDQI